MWFSDTKGNSDAFSKLMNVLHIDVLNLFVPVKCFKLREREREIRGGVQEIRDENIYIVKPFIFQHFSLIRKACHVLHLKLSA